MSSSAERPAATQPHTRSSAFPLAPARSAPGLRQRTQPVPNQPTSTQTATASQPASPPPQAKATAAATASSVVQGPPAPGFDTVPASAGPAGQPSSQLNAITLAQASAPREVQTEPASPPPLPAATAAASGPVGQPPARQQINPEVTRSLADIIHAIDVPEAERQPSVAAVDLAEVAALQAQRRAERDAAAATAADKVRKAAAAKAKVEADAKAKRLAEEKKKAAEEKARLAANPSRNWLQVGTGANKGALAFTMKNLRRKYDSLEPQDAWVAGWGRTNRLLVGPFASFTRVKALEDKLKAAGADVFAWKSDAGEVVERLPAK